MRIGFQAFALGSMGIVGACASVPAITGDPAVPVTAVAETVPVGTANEDAADDPAIWRNAADPAASLIVATDKKSGLYVYDLKGAKKHFVVAPGLNNVDLVDMGAQGVIVVASDRSDLANAHFALFRLDTATAQLVSLGRVASGVGEAYGVCVWQRDGQLIAYAVPKQGVIGEYRLTLGTTPSAELLRTMRVPTQPEGCAIDTRDGTLYIAEEDAGIWRFRASATTGEMVAPIDNRLLVADVEGLALIPEGTTGGWLYASSQGDNTYMRFALPGMTPAGRFRIAAGAFGATEETDGIEAKRGDFGPAFPRGIFIAQDGRNGTNAQNFKLVPLGAIEDALGD
ncbi:phytase [Parerythrobacter aurantius]|uniref:phytase n=1 Tax=Parerythrobacter aurantius TaxID=3127706 RepID=UPI0032515BA8